MKFPPDYPYSPPSIRFMTKVWHPNVYEVSKQFRTIDFTFYYTSVYYIYLFFFFLFPPNSLFVFLNFSSSIETLLSFHNGYVTFYFLYYK